MTWGFERGRVYIRQQDIHERFGGQEQGGIITPARFPLVIIISGEQGLALGYSDRDRADGVFEYFGAGQLGPMEFVRGNTAIRDHWKNGKDLLLFKSVAEGIKFEGTMIYTGHHFEEAPDRENNVRRAIVFELRPLEAIVEAVAAENVLPPTNLFALRRKAFEASNESPARISHMANFVTRSRIVRDYVLARSNGICEGCNNSAPFKRPGGTPYLEPHHIRRLSDGGPDEPRHVIALCPNCHRRVHCGEDGKSYNESLMARMKRIEPD